MGNNNLYCLMTAGVSLTPRMADVLFDAACTMLREGRGRKAIRDPDMEGEIRTTFEERMLGWIGGVEFHATIETESGTGKVKYLVRSADVERRNELEWVAYSSTEELMADLNSPPSRRAPMSN